MKKLLCLFLMTGCTASGLNQGPPDMTAPPDLLPNPDLSTPVVHSDLAKWLPTGGNPSGYLMGVDPNTSYMGGATVHIKSKLPDTQNFGALIATMKAGPYVGKRLRCSAWMKSADVAGWGGLWLRLDGAKDEKGIPETLGFDNMFDRPIRGTTDWAQYSDVLDVPEGTLQIVFGILVEGDGELWAADVTFEVVDESVPTTGS